MLHQRRTTAVAVLLAVVQLAAVFAADTHQHRKLLQNDALSNSNGCIATIPKCEPGACATRNVMGVARWVCLRCLANYQPVVDASGQDNIIQCGEHRFRWTRAETGCLLSVDVQEFCQACPSPSFYAPVDGAGTTVTSNSTTLFDGAFGVEACVPLQSQLSPEAGQAYFSPENTAVLGLLTTTNRSSLAACFAACRNDSCCLMQYDATNRTCRIASLPPVAFNASVSTGLQLLYKLPPSTMGSASSIELTPPADNPTVGAKTIASGYYATCSIPAATAAVWQTAGTNLGPDARTFVTGAAVWDTSSSKEACQRRCDESNVCWGVIFNAATGACLYRGGVDALATRSLFVMPSTGLQGNGTQQQCPVVAPVTPTPADGALPGPNCPASCAPGLSCIAGQCACPAGLQRCGTTTQPVCVNTTSDDYNCGLCGRVCMPGHRCYDSVCAEAPVKCGSSKTYSGSEGNFTYSINIGTGGPRFKFEYDAYDFPDRFNVYYPNGTLVFSRLAGTPGNPSKDCKCNLCRNERTFENDDIQLARPPGVSSVQVVVNGYCQGTTDRPQAGLSVCLGGWS